MIRSAAPRAFVRPLARAPGLSLRSFAQPSSSLARSALDQGALANKTLKPLALSTLRQSTSLIRSYATTAAPGTTQNHQREAELGKQLLKPDPEIVSTSSSVHPVFSEVATEAKEDDADMMAGVKHDLKVIQETFNLREVPVEAYRLGLAGVLPYLATSTATVYCAFEYNHASHNAGVGWVLSEHTSELALHILEPLQVGYGAVILSFLGAVHWGLEWAKYGGTGGYPRYAIGVLAPAVAWPTVLMPVEYALISQFLAFNLLYAVDSSATTRGWTPPWYGTYRFILTFIVGASIVLSLVGRGQVTDRIGTMPNAADRVKELNETRGKGKKKAKKSEE